MNKEILKTIKDEKGRIVREAFSQEWENSYYCYSEYIYDEKDNIIKDTTYNLDGTLHHINIKEYNINGNLIKRVTYNEQNVELWTNNYYYDDQNRLIKSVENANEESKFEENTTVESIIKAELDELKELYDNEEYSNQEDYGYIYEEFFWDDKSEITEYEYNDDNKLIKELLKTKHGLLLATKEYEYTTTNIEKMTMTLSNGQLIKTTVTEENENNEIITKFYDKDNNLTTECHDYYDNNKIVKTTSRYSNGETSIITYANEKEIERILRNSQNILIHHQKRHYDENGILKSVEIIGEEKHEINAQNSKYLTKDLIIKYDLYMSAFLFTILFATPTLLILGLFIIYAGIVTMSEDMPASILFMIVGITFSALAIWSPIHLPKTRNKYITYTYDVNKGKIIIENLKLSENKYSSINKHNKDVFVPIILNLNAISSGVFICGNKYYGDRLALLINDISAIQIPLTVRTLNILKSFIKIENLGFFPKLFIKNIGNEHDLSEYLK